MLDLKQLSLPFGIMDFHSGERERVQKSILKIKHRLNVFTQQMQYIRLMFCCVSDNNNTTNNSYYYYYY